MLLQDVSRKLTTPPRRPPNFNRAETREGFSRLFLRPNLNLNPRPMRAIQMRVFRLFSLLIETKASSTT